MKKSTILGIIHVLLVTGPVIYFAIQAFVLGEVHQKLTLGLTLLLCLLMVLLGRIRKKNMVSPLYFLIIGVNLIIGNLMYLFFTMAITTFFDEILVEPIYQKQRRKEEILKVCTEKK